MSAKGLGRGLSALLSDSTVETPESAPSQKVNISRIEPNAAQPRKLFNPEALQDLVSSIQTHGILQPLAVRKLPNGNYQIIAGERRWRAAREAGLTEVPVYLVEATDRAAMELALVENLQRQDLNPIEEAEGFQALMEEYQLTQEDAAARVGKSRPAVANAVRLLALPPRIKAWVADGTLSVGHARALLAVSDAALQQQLATRILEAGYNVRQTEALIKKILQEKPAKKPNPKGVTVNYLEDVGRRLSSKLGRRVTLVDGRKKGRVELEYYGSEDLEHLLTLLERVSH